MKAEISEYVGYLIRQRRRELGLSQQDIASAIGLTRTSITNIEKGRQTTTLQHLYTIGSALQCDPREFLPDPALVANGAGELVRAELIDRLQAERRELETKLAEVDSLLDGVKQPGKAT